APETTGQYTGSGLSPDLQSRHRHDPRGIAAASHGRGRHTRPHGGEVLRNRAGDRVPADPGYLQMKRVGILISGRGSNFEAIADSIAARRLNAEIAAVISNRADARGLEIARQR